MSMIGNFKKASLKDVELLKSDNNEFINFFYNDSLDIDKTWDVLNYLLTGNKDIMHETSDKPINNTIGGGDIVIDKDLSYGFPVYLSSEKVKQTYSEIKNITKDDLRRNFIPKQIFDAKLYPLEIAYNNPDDIKEDEFDYAVQCWDEIKELYKDASENDMGVFFWLS